ncbi:MAG: HEAT repeat domain-containing protein [Candidatus Hodarchaeota archaeon]
MPSDLMDNQSNLLKQIMEDMNSKNSLKRAKAIKLLGQMELSIHDISLNLHSKLEDALFDSESKVRREAVMTLAFIEGTVAIPLLEPLLNDPVLSVRSKAIAAISFAGGTPSDSLVCKLIEFLNDPTPEIRDRSARALGRLHAFQAKKKLIELAKSDKSPVVRTGAVVGLGLLNDEDSSLKSTLCHLLKSETSNSVISAINEVLATMKNSVGVTNDLKKE